MAVTQWVFHKNLLTGTKLNPGSLGLLLPCVAIEVGLVVEQRETANEASCIQQLFPAEER